MDACSQSSLAIVVLISGGGSNLQSIIDRIKEGSLSATLRCVISDQENAGGLQRAVESNIPTRVISPKQSESRHDFNTQLVREIAKFQPDLVVLAGYMRILDSAVIDAFDGKIINIHPSLLPKFRGLDTHQRAISAGEKIHGATVHFVTAELDAGPIIAQRAVDVRAEDSAHELQSRVLQQEHIMLPEVIQLISENRVSLKSGKVLIDGKPFQVTVT
ncbi:MAG: phosphoribosylglycinamide formyltransferase [Pseudomonadota bacterium]